MENCNGPRPQNQYDENAANKKQGKATTLRIPKVPIVSAEVNQESEDWRPQERILVKIHLQVI